MSARPSALLDLRDPYVAYCLDEAVVRFGESIEAEVHKVENKNPKFQQMMREQKLRQLLGEKPKFAAPAPTKGAK